MGTTSANTASPGPNYSIRQAIPADAIQLAGLRPQIDGETEYMDREPGEDNLDAAGWQSVIKDDRKKANHLFLVAEADNQIVGYSRCAGSQLKRLCHHAEFGVCVLQAFWGLGIGTALLKQSILWAETQRLQKLTLQVLGTNTDAIRLYSRYGFVQEGILRGDKKLSDGRYYDTILMAKFFT